jgi:competence protein ComEA
MEYVDALGPSRRRALAGTALVLLLIVLVGRHFTKSGRGESQAHAVLPADAGERRGARVVVHVVGAVRRPGLYRLRDGARLADAVGRAGGATRKADLESINLAAPAEDGLQVVVPRRVPAAQAGVAVTPGEAGSPTQGKMHLNTATLEELEALPGVGPVTAQKILDYRQQHGAFTSVDDLDAISGIGPKRLEQLRDAAAP